MKNILKIFSSFKHCADHVKIMLFNLHAIIHYESSMTRKLDKSIIKHCWYFIFLCIFSHLLFLLEQIYGHSSTRFLFFCLLFQLWRDGNLVEHVLFYGLETMWIGINNIQTLTAFQGFRWGVFQKSRTVPMSCVLKGRTILLRCVLNVRTVPLTN